MFSCVKAIKYMFLIYNF